MKLTIEKIKFKNIMSVGNTGAEIVINSNLLTLIVGRNKDVGMEGSTNACGKSSILQALMYGLYGEPLTDDVKKDKLINFTNKKNLEVTIWFTKDNVSYRIERGRKPLYNRFFIDNSEFIEDETQGTSKTTQEAINEILGISYDLFKIIVVLDTFNKPFLSMKEKEQKPIIEELLSMTILSKKADNLSKELKQIKTEIKVEEGKISAQIANNERIERNIDSLSFKENIWEKDHELVISKLQENYDILSNIDIDTELKNHDLFKNIKEAEKNLTEMFNVLENVKSTLNTNNEKLKIKQKQLSEAMGHSCPECGQEIHNEVFSRIISNLSDDIQELEKNIDEDKNNITIIEDELISLSDILNDYGPPPELVYNNIKDVYDHKNEINKLEYEIDVEKNKSNPYTDQINNLKESSLIDINYDTINELTSTKDHIEFLVKLLTNNESFIRKKIIDQNIKVLNRNLVKYLHKMMLPHIITFNNDLSVNIILNGNEYDFGLLSKGEKNRVMLSTSWAFRDTWESLNGSINLWFFDEVIDTGMDLQGMTSALEILDDFVNEKKKDVFLISHKTDLIASIENVLYAVKENNYTSYENIA